MTLRTAPASTSGQRWSERLAEDERALAVRLPAAVAELHETVVERATDAGSASLILSGSTARGRRTPTSDLDYHLVGGSVETKDLSRELDLHVLTVEQLRSRVIDGDDFVQWSVRFGLVVFDHGPAREAAALIAARGLWPDVERKRSHAAKSIDLARRIVATGDHDAALLQTRTALSLAARAYLLGLRVFPMSRAELPAQLSAAGRLDASEALWRCIHAVPALDELDRFAATAAALLGTSRRSSS